MSSIPGRPNANTTIVKFIIQCIDRLKGRKAQKDIASEAGFANVNVLSMIKAGTIKVPLDRVPGLAKALGCDPARLFLLALEQYFESSALSSIKEIFGTIITTNEAAWVDAIRKASDHSDPSLTAKRAKIIRALFGKTGA